MMKQIDVLEPEAVINRLSDALATEKARPEEERDGIEMCYAALNIIAMCDTAASTDTLGAYFESVGPVYLDTQMAQQAVLWINNTNDRKTCYNHMVQCCENNIAYLTEDAAKFNFTRSGTDRISEAIRD